MKELNFRFNMVMRLFTDLMWYVINIAFFQIIYMNVGNIKGWGQWEIVLFLGTLFIVDSLNMSIFYFNVFNIPNHVRNGSLDSFLLKPVSARYLMSVRNVNFSSLGNAIFGVVLVVVSVIKLGLSLSMVRVVSYILFILNGLTIIYSILFIVAALSIYFINTEGAMNIFFDIFQFGMKPDMIYRGVVKIVITYVIPLLVMVNFPVRILLNSLNLLDAIWGLSIGVLCFVLSEVIWRTSLKRYVGASS